jgi:thioredoxin 1
MRKAFIHVAILVLLAGMLPLSCDAAGSKADEKSGAAVAEESYLVTFVELGSVRCIPCKMMQPIMKDIEKDYAGQVKVVFYDVWTPEGEPFAESYKIRVIPTQVFLDKEGKEYFRHQGFFPKDELIKILQQKGVK